MAGQEAARVGAGEEAQILGVGLARDRQPGAPRRARLTSGLVSSPSGNRIRASDAGDSAASMYVWSLAAIGRDAQQRAGVIVAFRDACVVAGGQAVAAEAVGELQHRVEADVAVAPDARVRGLTGGERRDERLDHAGAELVAQIDREVRETHRVRERPRLRDRRGRTAAALGVVLGGRTTARA